MIVCVCVCVCVCVQGDIPVVCKVDNSDSTQQAVPTPKKPQLYTKPHNEIFGSPAEAAAGPLGAVSRTGNDASVYESSQFVHQERESEVSMIAYTLV